MDRYKETTEEKPRLSRVAKNDLLYDEIKTQELSRAKSNNNIKVIEGSGKTIDLDKIRKYLEESKNDTKQRRTRLVVDPSSEDDISSLEETKEYDLNSVLEKAKRNREIDYESERYKKLKNNEFDILKRIKKYEEEYRESEDEDEPLNTEERTLVDLINTVAAPKDDLLSALTGGETGEITLPIEEEKTEGTLKDDIKNAINKTNDLKEITITKVDTTALKAAKREEEKELELNKTKELRDLKKKTNDFDRSFFTNSMSFSKEDFEGFDEIEKNAKKGNLISKILLGVLVLLVVISLILIVNYLIKK